MKYPEKYLLKMRAGTLARIDAVSNNRADFVRAAVEAALGGVSTMPSRPKKNSIAGSVKEAVRPRKSGASKKSGVVVSADQQAVLDYVQGRRVSSRDVEAHFNWLGLRYSKAERQLLAAGLIGFQDGMMVAI
jgi:hypothetical protein